MNPEPRPRSFTLALPFPETGKEERGAAATTTTAAPAATVTEPEAIEACSTRGHPWDHCPNCGARLENRRCKYVCPGCHYFASCCDFD
ncbi:MAG TPA: hypothetical protein VK610_00805 [Rhodothermales bacterium]|nr:hypothetical protein [Rhodothermales bacterium]